MSQSLHEHPSLYIFFLDYTQCKWKPNFFYNSVHSLLLEATIKGRVRKQEERGKEILLSIYVSSLGTLCVACMSRFMLSFSAQWALWINSMCSLVGYSCLKAHWKTLLFFLGEHESSSPLSSHSHTHTSLANSSKVKREKREMWWRGQVGTEASSHDITKHKIRGQIKSLRSRAGCFELCPMSKRK